MKTPRAFASLLFLLVLTSAAQEPGVFLSHYAGQDVEPSADPDSGSHKGIQGEIPDLDNAF